MYLKNQIFIKFFSSKMPLLYLALMLVVFTSFRAPKNSPVAVNGKLQVIGTQLCNQDGEAIALHGVSFGWHNLWPRFYNEKAVKWLVKDWKVNVVRAAMGVTIEDNYLENPEFALKCMTQVIDGAIKNGVYVVIDFHSHKNNLEAAKEFFTLMATKYKNVPNVMYEIWNEPERVSWEEVKSYSEEVISVIRAIDPTNIILVGSPSWDQDLHLVAADPIIGQTNIMYTMHFYAGSHKKWLRDRTDAAMEKGIPIFVSECASMAASGDSDIDVQEWEAYLEWMDAKKLSWCVWSLSDKNETCSMLIPRASAYGNWKDDVIKTWGLMSRKAIRERNK